MLQKQRTEALSRERARSKADLCTRGADAARTGVTLRGEPATPLWLRTPMQILFIALLWWSTRG